MIQGLLMTLRSHGLRLRGDERGAFAVTIALLAVPLIGAVGYAVDMLRFQNAQAALIRSVDLTCKRAAGGDAALYPRMSDRIDQAQVYAREALANTALDPRDTTIAVMAEGADVKVEGRTSVKMTLSSIIGAPTRSAGATSVCTPAQAADTGDCPSMVGMVGDLATFKVDSFEQLGKGADFVVTRYDGKDNLKERLIIGKKRPMSQVKFNNPAEDDYAVVQEFGADGSIPAACNPFNKEARKKRAAQRNR